MSRLRANVDGHVRPLVVGVHIDEIVEWIVERIARMGRVVDGRAGKGRLGGGHGAGIEMAVSGRVANGGGGRG